MYTTRSDRTAATNHRRVTPLEWLTIGLTFGLIGMLVWTGMHIVLPQTAPIIYAGIVLPVAVIVGLVLRWRYAPVAAVVLAVSILLSQGAFLLYNLGIPEERSSFTWALLMLATSIGLVVSGVATQIERFDSRVAVQRITQASLLMVLGATLGGLGVNALPREADRGTTSRVSDQAQVIKTAAFRFGPDRITTSSNMPVELAFTNTEPVPHDFVIDELGVNVRIPPGMERQGTTFTVQQPGTYTFYCSVPGHRELGMAGILEVQP